MALSGKVDDCINVLRPKNMIDKTRAQDVTLYPSVCFSGTYLNKLVVWLVLDLLDIVERSAIIQAIHIHNLVLRILLHKSNHKMGSTMRSFPLLRNT